MELRLQDVMLLYVSGESIVMTVLSFLKTFKQVLKLQRCPVLDPDELFQQQQREKLLRLYGKT